MSDELVVRRGEDVTLNVFFYDEPGGSAVDPTSVSLSILFEHSTVYGPFTYAGATIERQDIGSFFREQSISLSDDLGEYQAKWTAVIDGETQVGYETFEVVSEDADIYVPGVISDYGELRVGRLQIVEFWSVKESGDSGERTLDISGQESAPPLTIEQARNRQRDLLGLRGALVPVTASDKPNINGFYKVDSVDATMQSWPGEAVTVDYTLNLTRLGSDSEIDFESRLVGTTRLNDFPLVGAQRWHAPPLGHYGYYTGATAPSILTRNGEDGALPVYMNIPANTDPRWGCVPEDYMTFAVRLRRPDGTHYVGADQQMQPGWMLENGLVRLSLNEDVDGHLDMQHYKSGAYGPAKTWAITIDGTKLDTAWDSVAILRNDPEEVTVRLIRTPTALSPGRIQLDLTLKRGSVALYAYLQRHASATLGVAMSTTEAGSAFTGGIRAAANDADGNKYVLGSTKTFTSDLVNGGISKAAVTKFDFIVGSEVGGGSAGTGNYGADLMSQYYGSPTERMNAVRR